MDLVRQLLSATEQGNISTVTSMLDLSDNVDITDEEGTTALQVACANGHENVARLLVVRGADLNRSNYYGWTGLMQAASYGHVGMVNLLLQNKIEVNAVNEFGTSALVLASYIGCFEIVKYLIDAGAEVDGCSDDMTPLMAASQHGHEEIARLLIDKGASVNKRMLPINWNALMFATLNSHMKIVELLLDRRTDVAAINQASDTIIDVAVSSKNEAILEYLLRRTHLKPRIQKIQISQSDIFEAVKYGNLRRVKELIASNINAANSSDKDGATPLMFAAMRGHTDIVDFLIEKHANVNAQDKISGWTSLMQATYYGHRGCVRRLIDAGADVTLKATNDYTAFDMASIIGDTEIVRMLAAVSLKVQTGREKEGHNVNAWSGNKHDRSPGSPNDSNNRQFDVESKGGLKTWWMRMSNRFRNLKIGRTSRVESANNSLVTNSGILHPSVRINNNENHSASDISGSEVNKEAKRPQVLALASVPKKGQKLPANVLAPIVPPFLPAPTFDLMSRNADRAKGNSRSPVGFPAESPQTIGHSVVPTSPTSPSPQAITLPNFSSRDNSALSSRPNSTTYMNSGPSKSPNEISGSSKSPIYPDSAFLPFSSNSRRRERDSNVIRPINSSDKTAKRPGSVTSASGANVTTTSIRKSTPVLRPSSGPVTRVASWNMDDSGSSISFSNIRSRQKSTQSSDEDEVSSLLKKLSLEKYTSVFEEQEVDMEAFLSLDDFDLKDLGINHDQSRKQILAAITELNSNKDRQRQNLLASFQLPGSVKK
ncbi:Ankyrin repeat and SAM domain-containing protein 6 [Trichoplax sp. H2]|nr:Ankyrin repeat and SAM domain-containing protein 6 [Trichoplax sp. H2]|eukprot:RDD40056.1 Ankyrin repeat and SAM domain-containing protein 6 [Trichoplax sp. H2]